MLGDIVPYCETLVRVQMPLGQFRNLVKAAHVSEAWAIAHGNIKKNENYSGTVNFPRMFLRELLRRAGETPESVTQTAGPASPVVYVMPGNKPVVGKTLEGFEAADTFDAKFWLLIASAAVLAAPVFANRKQALGDFDDAFCPSKTKLVLGGLGLFAAGVALGPKYEHWYNNLGPAPLMPSTPSR